MNIRIIFTLLLFTLFFRVYSQTTAENQILKTFHSISSNEILGFAEELSSPKYKGRLSGSPEYMLAAEWCAQKFREWGIKPANNDIYFQFFPNEFSEVYSKGKVIYTAGKGNKMQLKFPDDYMPGSNSASGKISAEMVYVGFGITTPESGYDDYKNVDVKGKIILLESGVPYTQNDTTLALWTPYAYHRYKMKNAVEHGAAGMLYMSNLANPNTLHIEKFVYAHISDKVAETIFADAGKNLAEVRKELMDMKTQSFVLPAKQKAAISAKTKFFPNAESCNVVGLIEGSDPVLKNEVIIVGGHLDGQGYLGEFFPSALDNASGVANILGLAKTLSESEVKPKRSVLFILIGGEECGLYGSEFYAKNPLFPVDKTVLMINLDMVGNGTGFRLADAKSYPELLNHFETANEKYIHRNFTTSEWQKNYGRPRTDAANFEKAGIKTFSLYTTESVFPVYYHHPLDKTNVLTPEIMEDAARLLYLGVLGIANDENL